MTKTVYTFGYTGRKVIELKRLVQKHGAVVFDIRFSPTSRNPTWRRSSLQNAFGARYRHIHQLGNENYRGGPTQIVDLESGVRIIESMGRPVILMCACRDYHRCHRKEIAEHLARLGFNVQELAPESTQHTTGQRSFL